MKNITKPRFPLIIVVYFFCMSLALAEDWLYEVQKNDNLWDIAVKYLIDVSYVEKIQTLNNITNPEQLLPHTTIIIPKQWIRHFPALIRVINLEGTAFVLSENSDPPKPLKYGAIVVGGDTITTEAGSTVTIALIDGSLIILEENSRLKIDRLLMLENTGMLDSHIKLESGRMEIKVVPDKQPVRKFEIETPAAVTSVRGTHYRVSSELEQNESRTEVLKGKVDVRGEDTNRLLNAGFGTLTLKNKPPLPAIKLLPQPDINSIPDFFNQLPPQFSMPTHENGHSYRLQVATSEFFQKLLVNKKINSKVVRMPEFPDGDYFLRIRAIDTQQLEGLNATKKITINALPESPFLVSPKTGEGILLENPSEFSWTLQSDIEKYHLQISKDANFDTILINHEAINENKFTVDRELALGKYYWRVAAIDQDGDGPFSDGQMFRRILPAPKLEPVDITDDALVIRSRKALPGQSYQFQMAEDNDFNILLFDEMTDQPEFNIPIPDGGDYFIRVRTIDPDGFKGPYTKPQSINIPYNYYWLLALLPLLALLAL